MSIKSYAANSATMIYIRVMDVILMLSAKNANLALQHRIYVVAALMNRCMQEMGLTLFQLIRRREDGLDRSGIKNAGRGEESIGIGNFGST